VFALTITVTKSFGLPALFCGYVDSAYGADT
jgi:hypothetical protein